MTSLDTALAEDLGALGPDLAGRAARYVLRGEGDIRADVKGQGAALRLKAHHVTGTGRTRMLVGLLGAADVRALERLGRLYAAAAPRGYIAELAGDLGWVEQLVWEGGWSAPQAQEGRGKEGVLELAWLEHGLKDVTPLIDVLSHLARGKDAAGLANFHRQAFASNVLSAPDVADFLVRHKDEVAAALRRDGDPHGVASLEDANVPVEAFADVLAELASDERVTLRRPAIKLLARAPKAARAALRAIAEDDAQRTKRQKLAAEALAKLPEDVPAPGAVAEDEVPPLTDDAKRKLRALCDEWQAQAAVKLAAYRKTYPHAPSDWANPIDDATLARAVAFVEEKHPWDTRREPVLAAILAQWVVSLPWPRVFETLAGGFAPAHVARLLVLVGVRDGWLVSQLFGLMARSKRSLEETREAARYAGLDLGEIDRAVLERGAFDEEARGAYLEKQQEVLEVALGVRAAPWLESYAADGYRRLALEIVAAMRPEALREAVREAVWKLAVDGNKNERPLAQAAWVHIGGFHDRLIASLRDKSADVRTNAAAWLARIRLPAAREALRAALAKEKKEATRAAIMDALESVGEPLDALLDVPGLLDRSHAILKKIQCPVLDWPEIASLPAVHFAESGQALDPVIVRGWIAETYKAKNPAPTPLLRLYGRLLRAQDREALAEALLDAWIAHDTAAHAVWDAGGYTSASSAVAEKGILAVVAAFGRAGIAERVARFLKTYYGMRAAQCKALLQMLAHTDDKAATQLLLATATRFRTAGIRAEAEKLSKELAERRGWTVDEMADRTIPTGGLDDAGRLELSYGARTFVVSLDASLRIVLHTSEGAPLKALPAAHKDEKEDDVKGAKAAFSRAKKEIESVIKMQRSRLYEGMCTQRTWRMREWRTFIGGHPIASRLAAGLVWTSEEQSFRPLEDGALTTADHGDVRLAPDALVRLAHPLTMHDADIGAWLRHLGDFEILPLFPQFGRPVTRLSADEEAATEMATYVGHMIEAFKLRGRATALGYVRGAAEDGGWFYEYTKVFPSLGLQACLSFSGNGLPEENRTVALGAFSFERDGHKLALGKVPPVLFSEVAADMGEIAQQGTGFDPQWESKVR